MAFPKVSAIVIFATLALNGCAGVQHHPTSRLDPGSGRQASQAEIHSLAPEWDPFLSYTEAYDVKNGDGRSVLAVVAVSAVRYYENLPSGSETVTMPKPVMVTPSGAIVGSLPLNFPDDPPFAVQLTFTNWVNGWPQRIGLFIVDPTVTGNHEAKPLVWDASLKSFVQQSAQ